MSDVPEAGSLPGAPREITARVNAFLQAHRFDLLRDDILVSELDEDRVRALLLALASEPLPGAPPCANGHTWTHDYGDDWTPEKGMLCDCRAKAWGIPAVPLPEAPRATDTDVDWPRSYERLQRVLNAEATEHHALLDALGIGRLAAAEETDEQIHAQALAKIIELKAVLEEQGKYRAQVKAQAANFLSVLNENRTLRAEVQRLREAARPGAPPAPLHEAPRAPLHALLKRIDQAVESYRQNARAGALSPSHADLIATADLLEACGKVVGAALNEAEAPRAPLTPSNEETYRAALERIWNYHGDCMCEHDENCCARLGETEYCCPYCIAALALGKDKLESQIDPVTAGAPGSGAPLTPLGNPVRDWRWAAQLFGEKLAADGPVGYYTFTPSEWFDWAIGRVASQAQALEAKDRKFDTLYHDYVTLLRNRDETKTALEEARQQIAALTKALTTLRIDANRLCDRQLGGSYEQDCRAAIKLADAALAAGGLGAEKKS